MDGKADDSSYSKKQESAKQGEPNAPSAQSLLEGEGEGFGSDSKCQKPGQTAPEANKPETHPDPDAEKKADQVPSRVNEGKSEETRPEGSKDCLVAEDSKQSSENRKRERITKEKPECYLYIRVLRAKIRRTSGDGNIRLTLHDKDGEQMTAENIAPRFELREKFVLESFPRALAKMKSGESLNLISSNSSFPAYGSIEMYGMSGESTGSDTSLIGKANFSLEFLKESPGKMQCKWVDFINGEGSVRLCLYYSPDAELPTESVEDLSVRRKSAEEKKRDIMELKLFVGTWNLSGRKPPDKLGNFIPVGLYDLYFIGTQECGASIEASVLMNYTGTWERQLEEIFAKEYQRVESTYLVAIHGIVYIRKSLAKYLSFVETSYVPTGFGNLVGNKGGIGISMNIGKSSLLFINSHFHAFVEKVEARNMDYHEIEKRLPMRRERDSPEKISDRFDFVFWAGDLNYRCLCNRAVADTLLRDNDLAPLIQNEQLKQQIAAKKIFQEFREAKLTFAPTYKFDVGTNSYDTSEKMRVPSWTDRILWKCTNVPKSAVECMQYDSVTTIRTSDHKPVFGLFKLELEKDVEKERRMSMGNDMNTVQGSSACTLQ